MKTEEVTPGHSSITKFPRAVLMAGLLKTIFHRAHSNDENRMEESVCANI